MAYVEPRKSGFLGIYRDEFGKKKSKKFDTEAEALQWAELQEMAIAGGTSTGRASLVSDYAAVWNEREVRYRASTMTTLNQLIDARILPSLGDVPVRKLSKRMVQGWVYEMHGDGLMPSTITKTLGALRKIMAEVVRDGVIEVDPAADIVVPKVERAEQVFLTGPQLSLLIEEAGKLEYHVGSAVSSMGDYAALVATLGMCGLRISEAAALRMDSVKIDPTTGARVLMVREGLTVSGGKLVRSELKTNQARRDVPVPDQVWEQVERYLEWSNRDFEALGIERPRLFMSPRRTPVKGKYVDRDCIRRVLAEHPELPSHMRVHDLRHTAVSLWIDAGYDPVAVARLAGHKSVSVVLDTYAHLWPNRLTGQMKDLRI